MRPIAGSGLKTNHLKDSEDRHVDTECSSSIVACLWVVVFDCGFGGGFGSGNDFVQSGYSPDPIGQLLFLSWT